MKKYYVDYTENCTPKLAEFKTKEALYKFVAEFASKIYDDPGSWVNFAFEGSVFLTGDNYKVEKK